MTAVTGGPLWSAGKCAVKSLMSFGKQVAADRPCGAPCTSNAQCQQSPSTRAANPFVITYDHHGAIAALSDDPAASPAICVPSTMARIKSGVQRLQNHFSAFSVDNTQDDPLRSSKTAGVCRRCVPGGTVLPGGAQVKRHKSIDASTWSAFEGQVHTAAYKCKRNSDCMSDLCFGNAMGLTEGHCAPYNLPPFSGKRMSRFLSTNPRTSYLT